MPIPICYLRSNPTLFQHPEFTMRIAAESAAYTSLRRPDADPTDALIASPLDLARLDQKLH